MAYIGNQPTIGQYRKLDDISGSFNGSLTAFTMQVGSTNVTAGSAFQLLISLGGVIQNPGTDFTVSGSTLTFTTAPAASLSFFGILMGQPLNTATPGDSTVTGAKIVDGTITGGKLAAAFNYDSGLLFLDDTNNRVGIGTTSPSFKTEIVHTLQADANLNYSLVVRGDDSGTTGESAQILLSAINATSRGAAIAAVLRSGSNDHDLVFKTSAASATPSERARIDSSGRLLVGTIDTNGTQLLKVNGTTAGSLNGGAISLTQGRTAPPNGSTHGVINFGSETRPDGGATISSTAEGTWTDGSSHPSTLIFSTTASGATTVTERMRMRSDGHMQFNGGNVTTSNGNVGRIYKFFGGANNIIFPLETSGATRAATFEFRRTGRVNERTAQLTIGENASSQGKVEAFSSGTNGALSGGVVLEGGATSWASASDIRLKNVVSHFDNALQDVSTLDAFRFTWKNDASETLQVGLSAQSVQAVLPEATSISGKPIDAAEDDDTEYLSVRYTEVIPLLVAALQESKERIETLEAKVAALEAN